MKKKINWKIGNSTVREPLKVLRAFNVYASNYSQAKYNVEDFVQKLNETGLFNLKSKLNKMHGNFVHNMFKELGLIKTESDMEIITPIGYEMLDADSDINKIYLQQLSKFQFKNDNQVIKPFIIFLNIFHLLLRYDINSITKAEFELFIMTCMDVSDCENKVFDLLMFRKEIGELKGINKRNKERELKEKIILHLYSSEFLSKEKVLTDVLSKYSVSQLKENDYLLNEAVSTRKGYNSKKIKFLKHIIISSFERNNDVSKCVVILKSYFCDLKIRNLSSDAQITLKYFNLTDLFVVQGKNVSLDQRYRVILSYIIKKHSDVKANDEEYIKSFCYNRDVKLTNRVMRVEVQNNFMDALSQLKNSSLNFMLAFILYTGFIKLEHKAK